MTRYAFEAHESAVDVDALVDGHPPLAAALERLGSSLGDSARRYLVELVSRSLDVAGATWVNEQGDRLVKILKLWAQLSAFHEVGALPEPMVAQLRAIPDQLAKSLSFVADAPSVIRGALAGGAELPLAPSPDALSRLGELLMVDTLPKAWAASLTVEMATTIADREVIPKLRSASDA